MNDTKVRTLDELPDILDAKQVADVLQLALRSAYKLLREGKLRSIRIGQLWRVTKPELQKFIESGGTT